MLGTSLADDGFADGAGLVVGPRLGIRVGPNDDTDGRFDG